MLMFRLFFASSLIALLGSLALPVQAGEDSSKIFATRELSLKDFQRETLQTDLPARQLFFAGKNELGILGQTALWLWQAQRQKLTKIQLLPARTAPAPSFREPSTVPSTVPSTLSPPAPASTLPPAVLQQALLAQGTFVVVSDESLFRIHRHPFKIRHFAPAAGHAAAQTRSFGLLSLQDRGERRRVKKEPQLFWVTQQQVWTLAGDAAAELQLWQTHPSLELGDQVLLCPEEPKLWVVRKNTLLVFDYLNPRRGLQLKLSLGENFLKIAPWAAGFVLSTPHSVLVFDRSGDIAKTLPLFGSHRLLAAQLDEQQHTYLLDDNLLEVHQLPSQTSRYARLEGDKLEQISELVSQGPLLAFLEAGKPRLFQIEADLGEKTSVSLEGPALKAPKVQ